MKFTRYLFICILIPLLCSCNRESSIIKDTVQQQIQQLTESAEFSSVQYTVKKIIKANDVGEWYKIGDRKILFSCTAYLKAGVDFKEFNPENVTYDPATKQITITLPAAKIVTINMPAEEIQLAYDQVSFFRSEFSAKERTALLKQGQESITSGITEMGILKEAENNIADFIKSILIQKGYSNVIINFEQPKQ